MDFIVTIMFTILSVMVVFVLYFACTVSYSNASCLELKVVEHYCVIVTLKLQ